MSSSISHHLGRIQKAAKALNELSGEVGDQITALDEFLVSNNLGLSTESGPIIGVQTGRNSRGHMVDVMYRLGYGRDDDGNWGLLVIFRAQKTNDQGEVDGRGFPEDATWETLWKRRLVAVSRDLRLAACKHLPTMLKKLAESAEASVDRVRDKLDLVRSVAAELKQALGSKSQASKRPSRSKSAAED